MPPAAARWSLNEPGPALTGREREVTQAVGGKKGAGLLRGPRVLALALLALLGLGLHLALRRRSWYAGGA